MEDRVIRAIQFHGGAVAIVSIVPGASVTIVESLHYSRLLWSLSCPTVLEVLNFLDYLTASVINRHSASSYFVLQDCADWYCRVKCAILCNPITLYSIVGISALSPMLYHTFKYFCTPNCFYLL